MRITYSELIWQTKKKYSKHIYLRKNLLIEDYFYLSKQIQDSDFSNEPKAKKSGKKSKNPEDKKTKKNKDESDSEEENLADDDKRERKTGGTAKGNLTLSSIDKKSKEDKLYGDTGDITKNEKINPFTY